MSRELRQFSKSQLIDVARNLTLQKFTAERRAEVAETTLRMDKAGVRFRVVLGFLAGLGAGLLAAVIR